MILGLDVLKELKNSVTFKVLKVVFSIYFVVTLTVTGAHMYAEYKGEQQALKRELKLFERTFKFALAEAIWKLDSFQVRASISGLLKNPIIVGVAITSTSDGTSWKEGVIKDLSGKNIYIGEDNLDKAVYVSSNLIEHKFEIPEFSAGVSSGNSLGVGILYSSSQIVMDKVKLGFLFIIGNAVIKTIALWYLFLWSGTKYLSQPLGKFTSSVESINLGNLNEIHVVHTTKDHQKNELHKLQDAFNKMVVNLKSSIQEQHLVKEALENSERYLQDVFNSMPSILISVDSEMYITHWNKSAEMLTEISMDQALNKKIEHLLPFLLPHLPLINMAMNEKDIQKVEKIGVVLNEEEHFFGLVVYPLGADLSGVVLRIDDISERVMMENVMVQTEKMTSLGTLAAGMAHEINNPLGGILQGIQNVTRRLDPNLKQNVKVAEEVGVSLETLNQYLEKRDITTFIMGMKDLGERAAFIVKNVLKFSRRSDSQMVLTNVNMMVQDTISIISTDYDIKKQTSFNEMIIKTDLAENIPDIICTSAEVEQVLLNLMKNAAHTFIH